MTTEERLKKLEELEAKAAPGEWEAVRIEDCMIEPHVQQLKDNGHRYTICTPVHSNDATMDNMKLIAHLRNEARWLVGRIRALEKVKMEAEEFVALFPEHLFMDALKAALSDCDE